MKPNKPILTERFSLRDLQPSDASDTYVEWMSNPDINRYLESRFALIDRENLVDFITSNNASTDSLLLGIFVNESGEHIGNIKLGPIDSHHGTASIGLVIGDQNWWGVGAATEVINAISDFAFNDLGLAKLTAGAYGANIGSMRAFEKAGFHEEGRLISQVELSPSSRDDVVLFGRLASSSTGRIETL